MNISDKKAIAHKKAENFSDNNLLESYNRLKSITVWSYHHDPKLSKLSSDYDVRMMAKEWQDEATDILSNKKFTIVLIDKMLHHDPIALSMYEILYKNDSNLILEDGEIFTDRGALLNEYIAKGGDYNAKSEMNAERWLLSPVGELCLNNSEDC